MDAQTGSPHCLMAIAEIAPIMATSEPTDRSMCPAMITITMPMARITT